MTPESFETKMKETYDKYNMKDGNAGEEGHMEMDAILVETLRSLGYDKGCDIYESVSMWYA